MPVKIVGTHSKPKRIMTGLYSFDRAFINKDGDIGMPVGIGYEMFGLNHTGKSTFAYSLAAIIGRETPGNIALADFEGFDDVFLTQVANTQGFDGKIYIISDPDDATQLDDLVKYMTKSSCVGIIDSIGAIAPMAESTGELGEANMGKRAFLMAQFSRKIIKLIRFNPDKTVLMVNHWYPRLGGYGFDTPGGEAKKYLASVRIKLQRGKDGFPDKSYTLIGTVVKNRWGYQDNVFQVFMLAGFGLHAGMTALWDCLTLKLIRRNKGRLFHEKEDLGLLGHFAKSAKQGQNEVFDLFYRLLEGHNAEPRSEPEDTVESDTDDNDAEQVDEREEVDSVGD